MLPVQRWEAGKPVSSLALSRDGRTLATGGFKLITLWDAATGRKERDIAVAPPSVLPAQDYGISTEGPQPGEVARLCFSPDGNRLASSDYGVVTVWNTQTGRAEMTPKMPTTRSRDMPFERLPGGGLGRPIPVRQVPMPNGAVLQFSPDGRTLVADADRSSLVAWDIGTGRRRSLVAKTDAGVLAFSPDGKTLVGGGSDGVIHIWDATTGRERHALRVASKSAADDAYGHTQYFSDVNAVTFSPDGRAIATGHQGDTNVRFWEVATAAPERTVPTGGDYVTSMALRPDGSFVSLQGGSGLTLRDGATGQTLHWFPYKAPVANSNDMFELYPRVFALSADGQTLAAGGNGNRMFDLDGKAVAVWKVMK